MSATGLPPGPRLPRPLQTVLWTWRYGEFTARGHARFGDTFTVRAGGLPPVVLTKDRDAIRRLFTGDPLVKRHAGDPLRPLFGEYSVAVLEPAEHLARRKLLLPPFHGERVQAYAQLMDGLAAEELDRWRPGDVMVVQAVAQALTLEVILQAVLGVSDPTLRRRLGEIFNGIITPLTNLAATIPQLGGRWNLLARPYLRLKRELDALLLAHVAATRADARLAEREDVLAMLVAARDEHGAGLSDEELRDELITLIAAGHETTATAIAWAVDLLSHSPPALARARDGDDAYMEAVVKEVLRMRPPLALGGARRVLEAFPIGRWTLQPGVTIYVNAHGLHHDPAVYPHPEAFRPERFLDDPPDSYAFLPFGGGAHRCLGAALALLEIKVVLRALLSRLELEPVSRQLTRAVPRAVTRAPRDGVRVRVRPRPRPRGGSARVETGEPASPPAHAGARPARTAPP